jgi:hypothetical protein
MSQVWFVVCVAWLNTPLLLKDIHINQAGDEEITYSDYPQKRLVTAGISKGTRLTLGDRSIAAQE